MSEQAVEKKVEQVERHPGIRPEMEAAWSGFIKEAIEEEPGDPRAYALLLIKQVSALIRGLDAGLAPAEVLKLVEPNTSYVMMGAVIQNTVAFSVRGEEFRLFWNAWHDRVHPDDETPPVGREPQRAIFKPWQINVKGRTLQLTGVFDPSEPLTKSPKYLENVNTAIRAITGTVAA